MPPLAEDLAGFAIGFDPQRLPADLRGSLYARAKLHFLDAIGIALACSRMKDRFGPKITEAMLGVSGPGPCTVLGSSTLTSAPFAALTNGSLVHGAEHDDTYYQRIVHTECVAVPTALALGEETQASGLDVLTSWLVATEIAIRLSLATESGLASKGFHNTSMFGVFGAAAASSRLLRLDENAAATAIALCVSLASGTNAGWSSASGRNKCLQPGWAAMSGILAGRLANAGYPCGHDTLDVEGEGFLPARTGAAWNRDAITDGIGANWHALDICFKLYPAGSMIQPAIDAAIALVTRHDVHSAEVEHIDITIPSQYRRPFEMYHEAQGRPTSGMVHAGSWPCNVARVILDRRVVVADLDDDRVHDSALLDLAARTACRIGDDADLPIEDRPTTVTVTTARGVFSETRTKNSGHPELLDPNEILHKYRANSGSVLPAGQVAELEETILTMERLDTLAPLSSALATA